MERWFKLGSSTSLRNAGDDSRLSRSKVPAWPTGEFGMPKACSTLSSGLWKSRTPLSKLPAILTLRFDCFGPFRLTFVGLSGLALIFSTIALTASPSPLRVLACSEVNQPSQKSTPSTTPHAGSRIILNLGSIPLIMPSVIVF